MLEQEYRNLVKPLSGENLKEFVRQFIMYRYEGEMAKVTSCTWKGGFVVEVRKKDKDIQRNILVADALTNAEDLLLNCISEIEEYSRENIVFRRVELIALTD